MQPNPLEQVLEEYTRSRSELAITLRDGSRIKGIVKDYDGYVIVLDGAPDTMLYRHSILKLAAPDAARPERPARTERPERPVRQAGQARPERQDRPQSSRPPQRPQRPRPEMPRQKEPAAEKETGLGSMGEAMQKWLRSQKGSE